MVRFYSLNSKLINTKPNIFYSVFSRIESMLRFRYPPYNVTILLFFFFFHSCLSSRFLFICQKTRESDAFKLLGSLPPRPTGPPSLYESTTKWWGKWFLLALAIAIAGGLTQPLRMKTANLLGWILRAWKKWLMFINLCIPFWPKPFFFFVRYPNCLLVVVCYKTDQTLFVANLANGASIQLNFQSV